MLAFWRCRVIPDALEAQHRHDGLSEPLRFARRLEAAHVARIEVRHLFVHEGHEPQAPLEILAP